MSEPVGHESDFERANDETNLRTPTPVDSVASLIRELRVCAATFTSYGFAHREKAADPAISQEEKESREAKAQRNFDRAMSCAKTVDAHIAALTDTGEEPSEAMIEAAIAVVDMIEGFPGYGTATNMNGRLKDQPEWVTFYNLVAAMRSAALPRQDEGAKP